MLQELYLENVVLIEKCRIHFCEGLNIFTGETGAGKTAIIKAIQWLAGQKADPKMVRQNASKAVVEGIFTWPPVLDKSTLENLGIDLEVEDLLIIRREIDLEKKSKAFLNSTPISLNSLQQIAALLLEITGQQAQQKLLMPDFALQVIDQFGELQTLIEEYQVSFDKQMNLEQSLQELVTKKMAFDADFHRLNHQLQEIEAANPKPGEDEQLFQEYEKLLKFEELLSLANQGCVLIDEGEQNLLSSLQALEKKVARNITVDEHLVPAREHLSAAIVELKEATLALKNYQNCLDYQPHKMQKVNDRLSLLEGLKRKYRLNLDDLIACKESLHQQVQEIDSLERKTAALQEQLSHIAKNTEEAARRLSQARLHAGLDLQNHLNESIREMNMQDAELSIVHTETKPKRDGIDNFQFYLKANRGGGKVLLSKSASGGEIARIFFSLKVLFSKTTDCQTAIFDEIDASIGGETAAKIGKKFCSLAQKQQLIVITHFPQVAINGDKHFCIIKEVIGDFSAAMIRELSAEEKKVELKRMVGGSTISQEILA